MKKRWLNAAAGFFLVLTGIPLSSGFGVVYAYFADVETSGGNTFTAWVSKLWRQTTQDDFSAGVLNNVDVSTIPGDVILTYRGPVGGTVTDTFDNENRIGSKTNLVVTGGQVKLTGSSSSATATLRPNAAGYSTQLSPHPASPNWMRVSEAISDGDASYVQTNLDTFQEDLYELDDVSLTGDITSVTVYINARSTSTPGQAHARTAVRTRGSTHYGTSINPLPTTYANYSTTYTTNPNGGSWTWADINSLQAGVSLRHAHVPGRYSRCTQVWVEVRYTFTVYNSPGTLVSTNLLSGINTASIDSFSYTASAIPSGTNLKVQFSQDNTNWYNSSGVLNGWDTLSQGTHSIGLSGLGWSGPNFYYKAEFTSDGTGTPVLDEIALNYHTAGGYVSPGRIASQVLDSGAAGASWDLLSWDETLPAGTDITFEVRASDTPFTKDAATPAWVSVGGTSPVSSGLPSGRYKQWRATLTTSNDSSTPRLHEVRLWYDP